MIDSDSLTKLAAADAQHLRHAREHAEAFATFVGRDEETGIPIVLAKIHEAWHGLADRHDRLLIWAAIEHGKTFQMAILRTLFLLGRDPSLRVAVVSNTYSRAEKVTQTVGRYIQQSDELKRAFPHLLPSEPWAAGSLTVKRQHVSKDASVQALGIHGNILGARLDVIVLDDILDYENCRTPAARQDLWDWYHATLAGRLTARGRVLIIGTAFHPDDLLHRLARQGGWVAYRYPVLDDATGQPRWPERWPRERVELKRLELGPLEFARQMMCVARDDAEARFRREWIEGAIARGRDKKFVNALLSIPAGCRVYTGVDLAIQQHSAADLTCFFTILVHPNGDREVLCIESGKWTGPDILARILDAHRRYQSIVVVENVAAQEYLAQFVRAYSSVPIKTFTTGRGKASLDFQADGLATEMANGKWIIPSAGGTHPEVDSWINDLLFFDPRAHCGDRLAASLFARHGSTLSTEKTAFFDARAFTTLGKW